MNNDEEFPARDPLLYWFIVSVGVALVALSFVIKPVSGWTDLPFNIGSTLIASSVIAYLYQRFGSHDLMHQIIEMRRSVITTKRSFELGIRDMWSQRRNVANSFWNEFIKPAHSEVWLFGIAELGYAEDQLFPSIIADGIARGCHYKILVLNPESPAAEELDRKEGGGTQVQGRIIRALNMFQNIQKQNTSKSETIQIRVSDDLPHINIVRADSELLVTQYMPPLRGYELFTIRVQNVKGGLFEQYERYFKEIWSRAKPW